VAAQTYPHLEVMVIDDGSTDPAAQQVFADQERRYPQFRFLRQANGWVGAARNRVLAEAGGEFFFSLDADNIAAPQLIERLVKGLCANPDCTAMTCFLVAFRQWEDLEKEKYVWAFRPTGGPRLLGALTNVYGETSGLMRTRDLRAIGGYDTAHSVMHTDWHVYAKLACAGYGIDVLPEHLLYYRVREESMTHTGNIYLGQRRVLREYCATPELSAPEWQAFWTAFLGFHKCCESAQHHHTQDVHAQLYDLVAQMQCLRHRLVNRLDAILKKLPFIHRLFKGLLLTTTRNRL
jgi:glycosyltransferase involved in cell wall biosynthesis